MTCYNKEVALLTCLIRCHMYSVIRFYHSNTIMAIINNSIPEKRKI